MTLAPAHSDPLLQRLRALPGPVWILAAGQFVDTLSALHASATPRSGRSGRRDVPSRRVRPYDRPDAPRGAYDGTRVHGILGVNVLRHYDLELDLPDRTLRLHPLGSVVPGGPPSGPPSPSTPPHNPASYR